MRSVIKNFLKKSISVLLCALLLLELASCGTLLYPERRDQKPGQIDVAVVLLDAIGLFFFIIPGVIAFAVDFSTGAIYLPSSGKHSRKEASAQNGVHKDALRIVKVDPKRLNGDTITRIVGEQTGYPIRLDDTHLIVIKGDERVDIDRELLRLRSE
jgi:hypothetical protein